MLELERGKSRKGTLYETVFKMRIAKMFFVVVVLSLLLFLVPIAYLMKISVVSMEMETSASVNSAASQPHDQIEVPKTDWKAQDKESDPISQESEPTSQQTSTKVPSRDSSASTTTSTTSETTQSVKTLHVQGDIVNPWNRLIPKSSPFEIITPLPDVPRPRPPAPKDFVKEPHRKLKPLPVFLDNKLLYPAIVDDKPINFDDVTFVDDVKPYVADVRKAQEDYRNILRQHKEKLLQKSAEA